MQTATNPGMPAPAVPGDRLPEGAGEEWRARLSILGACAFALAVVLNVLVAAVLATVGLVLLWLASGERATSLARGISELRLTAALVAVALVAALVSPTLLGAPPAWVRVLVPMVVVAFAVSELSRGWARRHPLTAGATVIIAAAITGFYVIDAARGSGIDVVQLHRQAAVALARGASPYGDAVSVPNGAPGVPPGSMIVGYPYPPIAAAVYAASAWLLGDPRWANLLLWIALAGCAVALGRERRLDARSAVPFLLLAALPGMGAMLQSGWTEMLSLALLALAAVTWRWPVLSGIALGAALGSKQYFIVALPLLAFYRGVGWRPRAVAAIATASLSVLVAFVSGPGDAWRSLVLYHATTPPRPDASNLVGVLALLGIAWKPPAVLGLGVSAAVTILLARRANSAADFWRALAAGLAAFFLLSSQAMPNYWYLVAVTALFGSQVAGHASPAGSAAAASAGVKVG